MPFSKSKFAFLLTIIASSNAIINQPNAEDFIFCHPKLIVYPSTTSEVRDAVRQAIKLNLPVKAFAAGHSTNSIICTSGMSVETTRNLNKIISVDGDLVTVQSGMKLSPFFKELQFKYGLAIGGTIDYGGVTVGGAIATGAHASSLKHGAAVHDYIHSVVLVDGMGEIRTISDAPTLAAVRANLGLLGVITEVTFKAIPAFKVRGKQIDLSSRINEIGEIAIDLARQYDYASLYWFSLNKKAIMHTLNRVPIETPGDGHLKLWDEQFTSLIPWAYSRLINFLNNLSENEFCLFSSIRADQLKRSETTEDVGYFGEMQSGRVCEKGNPKCLWSQVDDLHIAVNLDRFSEATKDIQSILKLNKACFPVFGIYVRFGMQNKADKVYFEIHILRSTGSPKNKTLPGFPAIDEIAQLLLSPKYQGEPHFGKNFPALFADTRERLGDRWTRFKSFQRAMDPNGLFENDFSKQLNSREFSNTANVYEGCALTRNCVCSEDIHCGKGYNCVAGMHYKEARTCKKAKGTGCGINDECSSDSCVLWRCV